MDEIDLDDLIDFSLFALAGYAGYEALKADERKTEQTRRVRGINLSRDVNGFFAQNYMNTQKNDPEQFLQLTRMTPKSFDMLSTLIESELEKNSWRKPIPPSCRLFLVLIHLSQGTPRQILARNFRMGQSTLSNIIYETSDVLWNVLQPLYLSPPTNENWQEIAEDFQNICNLPNCVSAVDGKQIIIRCPPSGGPEFDNYRGLRSIEVLAACDADYTFTVVDVESYGNPTDPIESSFRKSLLNGNLALPPPRVLPNSDFECNYFFAGNLGFPLKTYLMRPYPGRLINDEKLNFNKRISRASRVIENAFGILVARWRILQTTLKVLPDNAGRLVKACFVLHNFCKVSDSAYCPKEYVDAYSANDELVHPGEWRNEMKFLPKINAIGSNSSSREAFAMRDSLRGYLLKN